MLFSVPSSGAMFMMAYSIEPLMYLIRLNNVTKLEHLKVPLVFEELK